MRIRLRNEEDACLRDRIFELLRNNQTTLEEDLQALTQCLSHIQDDGRVMDLAKECGFTLANGRMNEHLELYYDIKQGRHDLGYVSKGWNDPGFRIGDMVVVPHSKTDAFKRCAYQLLKFCATNGIVMTVKETANSIEIAMDGVIYSEGFNAATFRKTIDTLNECVGKTDEMMSKGGSYLP